MWIQEQTLKRHALKKIEMCDQNSFTIMNKRINMIERGGGDLCNTLMSMRNLHFDKWYEIHMNSKNHEEGGYKRDLDLLIISWH